MRWFVGIGKGKAAEAAPEVDCRPEVYFELFDGAHGGIEYRYPLAIDWLTRHLASY